MHLPLAKRIVLSIAGAIVGMAVAHLVPQLMAQSATDAGRPTFEAASAARS